jgi:REP element-mobilizing transposase RayT
VDLYQEKYRIASNRKTGWDYAAPGRYFVTVCTQNHVPWLGEIRNGIMGLNDSGCVVADEIQRTTMVRPAVTINHWIVMPNHVHMIVTIDVRDDTKSIVTATVETHRRCVSTWVDTCIPLFRRRPHTVGSIVAQWKSLCTKRIRVMGHADFAWQRNYHDRIIRSDAELRRIQWYIEENPRQWNQI